VEWKEGWLRLAGGGTTPRQTWPLPALGRETMPAGAQPSSCGAETGTGDEFRDDFDSPVLRANWCSLRVPVDDSWLSLSERPGWLRLRGRDSLQSLFTQSLVARRLEHFQVAVETCLEFSPAHYTQMAGLVCYYDTRQHFYLRVTQDEKLGKVAGVVLTDDGAYDELNDSQCAINDWRRVYLRADIDCERLQFGVSPDGKVWRPIGPILDMSRLSDDYGGTLRFTGAMIGLCAQDVGGDRACADFDYFDYRPAISSAQPRPSGQMHA
jgi:xylan 1,4-beta-xylosidase